jgi:hypothetical protein
VSIERRNPLPVARYWIDLRPGTLDTFRAWVAANPTRIAAERFEAVETASNGVTWALFRVLQPTRFDSRTFGFPTVATPDIEHAADTAQRPPPQTTSSFLADLLAGSGHLAGVVILALALYQGKKQ